MLYDVLGIESLDKAKPRGTGEEILQKIGPSSSRDYLGI